MRRPPLAVTAVLGVCVSVLATGCSTGGVTAGAWSAARPLPIRARVPGYDTPQLTSLHCTSPGTCVMVGSRYKFTALPGGGSPQERDFAVSEAAGGWTPLRPVKGNGSSGVQVSCSAASAAGSCVVAGTEVTVNSFRAVAAVRVHGSWSRMRTPPGLTALTGPAGGSGIDALSCSTAGTCVVVGNYWTGPASKEYMPFRPFAVTERAGRWTSAEPVPGLVAFHAQNISAIACDPAGTCTAAGSFLAPNGHPQAFVVSERDGIWGKPLAITADPGVQAAGESVSAISCASPGNCTVAGIAGENSGPRTPLPFVVTERSGTWGRAAFLPGAPAVHVPFGDSGFTEIAGLACSAPDRCDLAGYASSISSGEHDNVDASAVFVSREVNGRWTPAATIPGLFRLRHGAPAVVNSLSCAAAGDCAAGGYYARPDASEHAWLATETRGTWDPAMAVPGLKARGSDSSQISLLSCAPGAGQTGAATGGCTAIGDYYTPARGLTSEHFFATGTRFGQPRNQTS